MIKTHFYTMQNGLRVLLIDTQAFPSLTTLLFVKAGSRYETTKNNGIAHFFEHMAFKGSKKYPDAQTLATIIEGLGGVFNAFTSVDHTAYYVKAPAEDAQTVVDVISDMIQHSRLDPKEVEKEKGVIIQEMNMYEDMPQRRVYEIFESLLYPDHPLGFDIIGTKETVSSFTRATFTDYIDQLYHPNNAVLVLAGGLTQGKRTMQYYEDIINKRFKSWKRQEVSDPLPIHEEQAKPDLAVQFKKSEQAHFILGFRTFPRFDERKYVLIILATILGAGMSSRLFREVREKRGLCYSIHTFTEYFDDAGYMATYAGVEPRESRVKDAMKIILQEHTKIAKKGVPAQELKTARELVKGRLILSLEDTLNVASLAGRKMLFESKMLDVEEHIRRIEAITADEVAHLAQENITPATLNCALIGPFKNKKTFEKMLLG